MPGDIIVHNHFSIDATEINRNIEHLLEHQHQIINKLNQMAGSLAELKAEFEILKANDEELKTAIAEEREQANAKLAELTTKVDELLLAIADGGTSEDRVAFLADITAKGLDIKERIVEVKAIIPDVQPEPGA